MASVWGWVFDSARYIRSMEHYFMDMAMYPEELNRLHQIIADTCEQKILAAGRAGADGVFFGEDMGTQQGLLFSPEMWREYFGEMYARLFGIAHEFDMKVFMHSCGQNMEIVPDLIEAGIDCFQFDQPALYDMPALAELFREKQVALWSPTDIQKIMPTGDREFIRSETKRMIDTFRGGLIGKNYPDLPGIGVEEEWDDWAYQVYLEAFPEVVGV
jgi:uroporphyrinogen decarboxylase